MTLDCAALGPGKSRLSGALWGDRRASPHSLAIHVASRNLYIHHLLLTTKFPVLMAVEESQKIGI